MNQPGILDLGMNRIYACHHLSTAMPQQLYTQIQCMYIISHVPTSTNSRLELTWEGYKTEATGQTTW